MGRGRRNKKKKKGDRARGVQRMVREREKEILIDQAERKERKGRKQGSKEEEKNGGYFPFDPKRISFDPKETSINSITESHTSLSSF